VGAVEVDRSERVRLRFEYWKLFLENVAAALVMVGHLSSVASLDSGYLAPPEKRSLTGGAVVIRDGSRQERLRNGRVSKLR
jgi:hypothetical protein